MIQKFTSFFTVLRESRHPFRLIIGQVLVKTGLNRFFRIRMNGYQVHFSKSALAVTLFADKNERHDDEDLLRLLLSKGDTYVDVGANIGTLACTAAIAVGTEGKVIAIEAHPVTFGFLAANQALNGFSQMKPVHSAVGNKNGVLRFSNINSDDQNKVVTDPSGGIEVPVRRLDDLLEDIHSIDVLKVDVEGYEKFIFEGAERVLSQTTCVVYESWDNHFQGFGYHTGDVINLLLQKGFTVYRLAGKILEPLHSSYRSKQCENLLALKDASSICKKMNWVIDSPYK